MEGPHTRRRVFDPIFLQKTHATSYSDATAPSNTVDGRSNNIRANGFSSATDTTSAAQRDWHVEILSGLFLRCDEQELDCLEKEVDRNRGQPVQDDAGVKLIDKIDEINQRDTLAIDETKTDAQFNSCPEAPSDFSVLSLIPSALRGICGVNKRKRTPETTAANIDNCMDSEGKKCFESDLGHPLFIPSSWKRQTYESLTLQELEQKVIKTVEKNGVGDRSQTGCLYSESTSTIPNYTAEPPRDNGESCNMMTILYNDCSLSALANWAMMDPPDLNHPKLSNQSVSKVTPMQSPMHDEEWEKYARETTDRMARDSSTHNVPVPPLTFRMCGVCGKFGHYEVECELLLERNEEQSDREPNVKKRKLERETASLDDNVRRSIVSKLAKEIRVERLLQGLMDDVQHEKSKKIEMNYEEEHYVARSTCCGVCKSGLAGNRMLMCDGCDDLYHLNCLDPPLSKIPEGEWLCDACASYDSDVSSVVEIEGCEGFVVEQRKRSLVEDSKQYSGVSLGQHQCQWSAAMSLVNETDPIVDDDEYLKEHIADANEVPNFIPGKLCWAKRKDAGWWPAMIVEFSKKAKQQWRQQHSEDFYTVRFFLLDDTKIVSVMEILPYLSYYEEMGRDRLPSCGSCGHDAFRAALKLSVSALGLKTIGQALKLSRSGVQKSLNTNYASYTVQKQLKSSGWTPPEGWEHAKVEEIDGFVILAKDDRVITSPQKSLPSPNKKPTNQAQERELTASFFENSSLDKQSIKMDFHLNEIVGGIVSWCVGHNGSTSKTESLQTLYGVVVAVNPVCETALVRTIPLSPDDFLGESVGSFIYKHQVGSSIWMPLNALHFVAAKPNVNDLVDFRTTLLSRMRAEMRLHSSRRKAAAVAREHGTVELAFDDDIVYGTEPAADAPTLQPLLSAACVVSEEIIGHRVIPVTSITEYLMRTRKSGDDLPTEKWKSHANIHPLSRYLYHSKLLFQEISRLQESSNPESLIYSIRNAIESGRNQMANVSPAEFKEAPIMYTCPFCDSKFKKCSSAQSHISCHKDQPHSELIRKCIRRCPFSWFAPVFDAHQNKSIKNS